MRPLPAHHSWVLVALLLLLAGTASAFDTVVIDAGHGGKDPGSGWYGRVEKTLCLDLAKRVDALLRARDVRTVMTRKTDTFVELSSRAAIANRQRRAIFVSLHFNADRDTSAHGFQTHYLSSRGARLAGSIQAALDRTVPGTNRGIKSTSYKVLRETDCTAVLVECGFLSNRREGSDCGSAAHRQKLAEAIVSGLMAQRNKL